MTDAIVTLVHDAFGIGAEEAAEPGMAGSGAVRADRPEAFFPEKGGSTREAKRVCRSCEVRAECLEYALEHDERFGIWGGLSERERRRLKRRPASRGRARAGRTAQAGTQGLRCGTCAGRQPSSRSASETPQGSRIVHR